MTRQNQSPALQRAIAHHMRCCDQPIATCEICSDEFELRPHGDTPDPRQVTS